MYRYALRYALLLLIPLHARQHAPARSRGRITVTRCLLQGHPSADVDLDVGLLSAATTASGAAFRRTLNEWKQAGRIRQWNATVLDVRPQTSIADVQLVARTSFSSANYWQDIVTSAQRRSSPDGGDVVVVVSVAWRTSASSTCVP